MALLSYARSDDELRFAVVADDTKIEYVWPNDDHATYPAERLQELLVGADEQPSAASDWLALGMANLLDAYDFTEAVEVPTFDQAVRTALRLLVATAHEVDSGDAPSDNDAEGTQPLITGGTQYSDAYDEVSQDYPSIGETDDDEEDPDGMIHLVLHALGPVDPEGPNGWVLRAIDGDPQPDDENAYVDFTGESR